MTILAKDGSLFFAISLFRISLTLSRMPNGISDSPQKRTRFTHEGKDVVEGKNVTIHLWEKGHEGGTKVALKTISVRTYFIFRAASLRYRHLSNGEKTKLNLSQLQSPPARRVGA